MTAGVQDPRPRKSAEGLEATSAWPLYAQLPMRLTAAIPLTRFRVIDLLGLHQGQLIESAWISTDDVPLCVGGAQLSWSEFEMVDQRMAVRITRLA